MIPLRIKLISIVNVIVSLFFMMVMGVLFLVALLGIQEDGLSAIMAIAYLVSIIGWIFMILGSVILLFGKKLGYYLLLIAWVFNLPNVGSMFGIGLFIWMSLSTDILRNNEECRRFLNLSDTAFFEKSWNKKKADAKNSNSHLQNFMQGDAHNYPQYATQLPAQSSSQQPLQQSSQGGPDPLAQYISDSRKKGYTDDQIKSALAKAGYSAEILGQYFR